MSRYRLRRTLDLVRQLALGPPSVRRRQADRLEELLLEFDPERTYPFEFLYFRITGFRPKEDMLESYVGKEVLPDLRRALKELSASVPRAMAEMDERIYTLGEVAEAFNVSSRTVRRWQGRGLVASTYLFPDGHTGLGVRQAALDRFLERNRDSVEWSRRFSKLSSREHGRIVAMARRLSQEEGLGLTATAARIAAQLGRAWETVRLALLRHEREHPDEGLLLRSPPRLDPAVRQRVREAHRQGTPVDELCERYNRSRATIYRLINQERASELLMEPVTWYFESLFTDAKAGSEILGADLHALLDGLSESAGEPLPSQRPPLKESQEQALFRAYNYTKFRIAELRTELNPRKYVSSELIRRIEELKVGAENIRDCLVRAYAPVAEQVARQHAGSGADLQGLLAQSRLHLARLVESFDYRGRARFSRYAQLELAKGFARADPAE
ncbi:MAG: hypothetical protein ACYTFZ_02290 [Planctomycetota bacterium]|jgi:DNA invertase Pin-like site-specific DNA recombinase